MFFLHKDKIVILKRHGGARRTHRGAKRDTQVFQ